MDLILSTQSYIFLIFAGFLAGWVDSIAGGGGLITIPALLSVGLPPHYALGTNKLQASFGSFTSTLNYSSKNLVFFREVYPCVIFTALGASLGTLAIEQISGEFLNYMIPVLLAVIFISMCFSPDLGSKDSSARLPQNLFYLTAGICIGFYDGFFGPGTGLMWAFAFVLLMGFNLKKATAHTKLMNFTSNIMALVIFICAGHVAIKIGLLMAVGEILGARFGSYLVIKYRVRFVRTILLVVIAITIAHMLYIRFF